MIFVMLPLFLMVAGASYGAPQKSVKGKRWSKEQSDRWYAQQPWLVGCDYIPSNAINHLEMWQAETFDTTTITKELKLAHSIGFNTLRVYLHTIA